MQREERLAASSMPHLYIQLVIKPTQHTHFNAKPPSETGDSPSPPSQPCRHKTALSQAAHGRTWVEKSIKAQLVWRRNLWPTTSPQEEKARSTSSSRMVAGICKHSVRSTSCVGASGSVQTWMQAAGNQAPSCRAPPKRCAMHGWGMQQGSAQLTHGGTPCLGKQRCRQVCIQPQYAVPGKHAPLIAFNLPLSPQDP